MKLLDLDNLPELSKDVQHNIKQIIKMYGKRLIIKYNKLEIPSIFTLIKENYNPNKLSYYSLRYDIDQKDRTMPMFPFKITFLDYATMVKNNDCYINNIHKTNTISGSEMVEFILYLLKKLGVERAVLHDGTRIHCGDGHEIDLSFFKLIEKNITFYQKFGFKFKLDVHNDTSVIRYGTTEGVNNALTEALDKFRQIETKYYVDACKEIIKICSDVVLNQDYDNLNILLYSRTQPYLISKWEKRTKLNSMIKDYDLVLHVLKNAKQKYLCDVLVDVFYKNCEHYVILENVLLQNLVYSVEYKRKKIILKHIHVFILLNDVRTYSIFEVVLN